jgi:hypothetical protein
MMVRRGLASCSLASAHRCREAPQQQQQLQVFDARFFIVRENIECCIGSQPVSATLEGTNTK